MQLLQIVTLISALKATLTHVGAIPVIALADTPGSALVSRGTDYTTPQPVSDVLGKRQHQCAPGQVLVYSFPNSSGSYAFVCTSRTIAAICFVLIANYNNVVPALVTEIKDWVRGNAQDASDAGPPARRRSTALTTWGELYNYTSASNHAGTFTPTTTLSAGLPENALKSKQFHEDGFSATIDLSALKLSPASRSLEARGNCYEQLHIHYWAAAGHTGTVLSDGGVMDLARHAIDNSYNENYSFACYEMSNSGAWDGWLRICYNYNQAQYGCGYCGGHNN